jgi:hypothetical protein
VVTEGLGGARGFELPAKGEPGETQSEGVGEIVPGVGEQSETLRSDLFSNKIKSTITKAILKALLGTNTN